MCLRSKAMYTSISRPVFLYFFLCEKVLSWDWEIIVNAAAADTVEEEICVRSIMVLDGMFFLVERLNGLAKEASGGRRDGADFHSLR